MLPGSLEKGNTRDKEGLAENDCMKTSRKRGGKDDGPGLDVLVPAPI